MNDKIAQLCLDQANTFIAWRRHIHQHPELSFEEFQTTAFIKQRLDEMGIAYQCVSPTGVVAHIYGKASPTHLPKKTLALRADIDALPIQEANDLAYRSVNAGMMHACGHDFHTANLLGTAAVLQALQEELPGDVLLIFQAAEEKIPGGAQAIVASGLLDVDNFVGVIGQHVSPKIPVGSFAFRPGKFMASSDEFYIDIQGRGGHGAQPHLNIDPVIIAAQLLVSLQQVVSRFANPSIPSVLSFGKVIANGAANVIPDSVHLAGTFRTVDEEWRARALMLIESAIEQIPITWGATVNCELRRGYPALDNDQHLIAQLQHIAAELVGADCALHADLWMAAEDFAYYATRYPAAFYLIGTLDQAQGLTAELHTPTFNIDESILNQGIQMMCRTAFRLLQH